MSFFLLWYLQKKPACCRQANTPRHAREKAQSSIGWYSLRLVFKSQVTLINIELHLNALHRAKNHQKMIIFGGFHPFSSSVVELPGS